MAGHLGIDSKPIPAAALPRKHELTPIVPLELERAGQAIGAMDLLIAALALALAATLVTNNLAHFQRISGLSVTRWP